MIIDNSLPFPFPREINSHILSYLDKTSDLCHFACVNSRTRALVHKFFEQANQKFRDHLLKQPALTNGAVLEALTKSPHLCEIDIEAKLPTSELTPDILETIRASHPRLRGFHLRTSHVSVFEKFTDEQLIPFLQGMRGMIRLTLQGCPKFKSPEKIPEICQKLAELTLDNPHLSDEVIEKAGAHLPRLRRLTLSGKTRITDKALEILSTQLPQLTHLELRMYHGSFTVAKVNKLLSCRQNLEGLALQGCENISDDTISLICKKNPNLRDLYLFGCQLTRRTIEELALKALKLEILHLNEGEDEDLESELERQKSQGKFQSLKSTEIWGDIRWEYAHLPYRLGEKETLLAIAPELQRQMGYIFHLLRLKSYY